MQPCVSSVFYLAYSRGSSMLWHAPALCSFPQFLLGILDGGLCAHGHLLSSSHLGEVPSSGYLCPLCGCCFPCLGSVFQFFELETPETSNSIQFPPVLPSRNWSHIPFRLGEMEHCIYVSGSFPLIVRTKENEGGTCWIVGVKERNVYT